FVSLFPLFLLMIPPPPLPTLFPYTTLFRSINRYICYRRWFIYERQPFHNEINLTSKSNRRNSCRKLLCQTVISTTHQYGFGNTLDKPLKNNIRIIIHMINQS